MFDDLQGKSVLITGASSGIGAAAAKGFAAQGAKVVVHFNSHEEDAQGVVDLIRADGGTAHLVKADLGQPDLAQGMVEAAAHLLGGLDVLVNNAGSLFTRTLFLDWDANLYDTVMNLNVRAVIAGTQAAVPFMEARGGGSVINLGSIAGNNGGAPGSGMYATAKAAIHNLTRHMASDLAKRNIRVNAIAPGVIKTPFHDLTPPERMQAMLNSVPMGRLGVAEDCVGSLLFLASGKASGYITGQILHINGGQMMAG